MNCTEQTCYAIKPQDFERRILDSYPALSRQMAQDVALKMSWREQTKQRLEETHRHGGSMSARPKSDENSVNGATAAGSGRTVLLPTPPTEPREKARPARPLADRYGSAVELRSKLSALTATESMASTEPTGAGTPSSGSPELLDLPAAEEALPAYLLQPTGLLFLPTHLTVMIKRLRRLPLI